MTIPVSVTTEPNTPTRLPASPEAGFSVVEVMMSTLLTLVMLGAAMGSLDDGLMMQENVGLSAEMHHNARIAMNQMTRDFMQAGQGLPTGGIPIPNGTGAAEIARPGPAPMTFGSGTQVLLPVTTGNAAGPLILGQMTDMVTIVYADSTLELDVLPLVEIVGSGNLITVDAAIDIQVPSNRLEVGDLIMFSNALGHAVQMVTSLSGQDTVHFASSDPLELNQRTAPAGSLAQLEGPDGFPPTTATRIWMITYYLDASVPDSPRLMRVVNDRTPRPVAMEIEGLQLTYDLVDGVINLAAVDTPVTPNSEAQIRKVNIALSARSYKTHARTSEYQRQMLTSQVSLRNLSFFDRYL
jgi:hypothetical protein